MEHNEVNFRDIAVSTLLPQQPPFVMIDHLTDFTMERTATELTVRADNIYVDGDGTMSRYALLENIAQTCAARIGYVNVYIYKRAVTIGYIGAIRNLTVYRSPRVGETLSTTIEVEGDAMGITLVNAKVKNGEEVIAEGGMKIAVSEMTVENDAGKPANG